MTGDVEMLTSANTATSSCCCIHPFTISKYLDQVSQHSALKAHSMSDRRVAGCRPSPVCCSSACMANRSRYGDLSWRSNLTVKVLTLLEDFSD